ncbi:hypothetical protein OH76DRAFT_102286 [Lentinus brumalis]|uniref:Uncharacterized protein n=1 Tax=Lentinus brumalis TaxID=2498619 RepID=A0A371CQB7_9APHY|nr:hypothetical protein OH76DRAFT_102286 [Polyporus brumalis]
MLQPYHASWRRLDTEISIWREFHSTWWGSAGRKSLDEIRSKPEMERFLHVHPPGIFYALTSRQQPSGGVLVRRDYENTLDRLREDHRSELSGVILVGQSGSGKTCFNVFLLLECMSQQQNALFTTCNSQTLLFDDHGVWTKLVTENVTRFDVPPFDIDIPTSRVWTILDACGGMHNPPPRGPLVWIMQPWLDSELLSIITQTGRRPVLDNHRPSGAISLQRVERVRAAAGPLPHDIFSYLRDPVRFLHDITKIVDDMRTGPSGSISIDWSSPVPFDKLLLLRPMGKPSLTRDNSYAVDFKSTTVSSIVRTHVRVPYYKTAEQAFKNANGTIIDNALCAWAFEALSILSTGGHIPPGHDMMVVELRSGLRLMCQDPSSTHTRPRFIRGQREDEDVLMISPQGLAVSPRGSVACIPQSWSDPESLCIPMSCREITTFADIAREVSVDSTRYFVSEQRKHPFFDAVFFDLSTSWKGSVIVWVIRTGLMKVEGDKAASSFDLLRNLQRKVVSMGLFPVLKYVVVVLELVRQTVIWEFPSGWKADVQGEVYVQLLDPAMTGGQRFMHL